MKKPQHIDEHKDQDKEKPDFALATYGHISKGMKIKLKLLRSND